jgi:AraC-like DNA-binding protein
MEWTKRMEQVLDYIEEHLTEPVDMDEIARIACCSSYNFQRVFSFCMELSLAEYIRNRRLSQSAQDLCKTDMRILDIAFKYGYDSQEAFSRAFFKFHGVTPKQARNACTLLNYCPKATLLGKESEIPMQNEISDYILTRRPSSERLKNKAPSPITLNFPVSMWTYMEYMGQNVNTMQTYTLLATLCGDAYHAGLALTKKEGILTALKEFGYPCAIYSTKQKNYNYLPEAELRQRILHEITDNNRPVIAVNMVDCCFGGVITGFKAHGNCLLNWGYFPFDFSDNPEPIITECWDWYEKTERVIFIGDPATSINLRQLYINGLKRASEYLGTSAALRTEAFFQDWKNQLINYEPLLDHDYTLIDPMWCDYAEKRFYAGQFMLQLRAYLPEQEAKLIELWHILGERINSIMYEYIAKVELKPGDEIGKHNIIKLQDTVTRKEMCELVSQCESAERKAADILEDIASALT